MTDQLLETIAGQGLLGIFLVLAFMVIFFLYKEAKKERDDRLTDMKDVWSKDVEYRAELKNLIQTILDLLRAKK